MTATCYAFVLSFLNAENFFFPPYKIFPYYCCFLYMLHLQSSLVNLGNEFRSLDGIIMGPCTLPCSNPRMINLHRWIKPHRAVLMPGQAVQAPSGRTISLKDTVFLVPAAETYTPVWYQPNASRKRQICLACTVQTACTCSVTPTCRDVPGSHCTCRNI